MGHQPHAHWTSKALPNLSVKAQIKDLINLRKMVQNCILKAQSLMAQTLKAFTPYQPGDQVWLKGTNIKTTHPTAKLAPKHHGPFTIKEAISAITYCLNLPSSWKIWNAFHAFLLTPYREIDSISPNYE